MHHININWSDPTLIISLFKTMFCHIRKNGQNREPPEQSYDWVSKDSKQKITKEKTEKWKKQKHSKTDFFTVNVIRKITIPTPCPFHRLGIILQKMWQYRPMTLTEVQHYLSMLFRKFNPFPCQVCIIYSFTVDFGSADCFTSHSWQVQIKFVPGRSQNFFRLVVPSSSCSKHWAMTGTVLGMRSTGSWQLRC